MKLKNQALSINQVQELIELGFDIEKHSSMYYTPNWITKFGVDEIQDYLPQIGGLGEDYDGDCTPTMSIGDIIEVLPEKIKIYSANAGKEVSFCLRINNTEILYISLFTDDFIGCWSKKDKLINNLFNTLVWCIKEKHIKLK